MVQPGQDGTMRTAMFNPLSSPNWHRVAGLRPRLAEHVRIVRQWVRGQRWYVLQDPRSGQSCRLNCAAYEVAARLDGRRDLHTLWEMLDARPHQAVVPKASQTEPPTQEEVLQVVTQLQQHQMLRFDGEADFGTVAGPGHAAETPQASGTDDKPASTNRNTLLAWRIPLLDPQPWLDRHQRLAHRLFSRMGLWLWGLLMLGMAGTLITQAEALRAHATVWMQTPRYLLLATLCYPLIKAWHEAAHALAVRRWGGEVHEAGLTLMMLMPVPYVDASAAHGFSQPWQRAVVSAAGIMAEMSLAALGLWCWLLCEPGWPRDIGFVVWFAGCLSTLLFNANPLQRLDGYHLLTDCLQLPNLATRSQQWWHQHVRLWLSAQDAASEAAARPAPIHSAPTAPGEAPWLVAYAPLSWLYQGLVWFGMSWWLGTISPPLGWAGMTLTMWMCLLRPGWHWLREIWQTWLWASASAGARRAQVARRAACLMILPAMLVLPWPDRVLVQGLVWAPDEALVRPEVEGFVQTVHQADGVMVQTGDLLITLHNPKLDAERARVAAKLAQAEQGGFGFAGTDSAKAGQAGDEAQRWQAELARIDEQRAALAVRAHHAGRLVLPHATDLPGRYVHRGELLGHVLDRSTPTIRVAVAESEVGRLQEASPALTVRLSTQDGPALPATLLRDSIGATRQLPSAALSQDMGGQILTDPRDEHHQQALRPVVLMDVQVQRKGTQGMDTALGQGDQQDDRLGERAWVRFDQGWSPLPMQLWRWVSRRAVADFHPAAPAAH